MLWKLRLDNTAAASVLTATSGSLKVQYVVAALKAVFLNGKGSTGKKEKDVFVAEESEDGGVEAAASCR